jgi:hypothetical protein
MSAQPVDVLAFFGGLIGVSDDERREWFGEEGHAELLEARAAVAELIEAAKFARLTGNGPLGYTLGADRRLAAALARVGGAP